MRNLLLLPFLLASLTTMAQAAPSWLETTLYGNGKINVVVAVVAIIILGMGVWMWRMDRRIGSIEKNRK